jgi:hypothetical protein
MPGKRSAASWTMGMLLAVLSAGVAQSSNSAARGPLLSAEEVVHRLEEKNQERAEALRQFQGTRILPHAVSRLSF